MNVDRILDTMNRHHVAYLLIGGMNFLLRHEPVLTFDVDLWVEDNADNLLRCEAALIELDAEWGASDDDWGPVSAKAPRWLERQAVFCLLSPHGAIDIFRHVAGLDDWRSSFHNAQREQTGARVPYWGISDHDMLRCQRPSTKSTENWTALPHWRKPSVRREATMTWESKEAEEARRQRHWDAAMRWRVLQDTITWAEAQATVRRNERNARLTEQARKLAWLASYVAGREQSQKPPPA